MKWEEYARPSVAVDVAVLTVLPGPEPWLGLLVHRRAGDAYKGRWDIPGGFVQAGETLADAVLRLLREKSDVRGLQPIQLHVFDDPDRDERGWVMSVAHMDAVPYERLMAAMTLRDDVRIVPIQESEGHIWVKTPGKHRKLPWDHDEIVTMAVRRLRERYAERPDPAGLLVGESRSTGGPMGDAMSRSLAVDANDSVVARDVGEALTAPAPRSVFTLTELRQVHEAVAGHTLQRDTFRRTVEPYLRRTSRTSEGRVGRPGVLYELGDE